MKLKEAERMAVQAWSPAGHHPICLAAGTSAQQLDSSFSNSAALDIFEVDFRDPSLEMKYRGSLSASHRFHKLIWGSFAKGGSDPSGVIVGGGDNGAITLYGASQSLASANEPAIGHAEKHTGPVRALDFNPFQDNLLASGANDSEIYIWDLNNFNTPMTPGAKSQLPEVVGVVAWNQQVPHILSSAHPSGRTVLWDLQKNEPIIKVSDRGSRMHCSGMAWHPEIATQLVLSSEDDRWPVIQIWDLQLATSPLSQLEGHTRGISSLSWCRADPALLLTSAKDSRILCWNLCTSEVVYELQTPPQWCFDVQWCPRNPSVFSTASVDGQLSLYSVMGSSLEAQQKSQADKISSAFSHPDPCGTGETLLPLQVLERVAQAAVIPPLKKPPQWIRRPEGKGLAGEGDMLGARMETEGGGPPSHEACLCYISSGNVERLVECWVKIHGVSSPLALQDLMEKVMVLTRSLEMYSRDPGLPPGPVVVEQTVRYASLLASQGCLAAAVSLLPNTPGPPLVKQLRDRLCHALGKGVAEQQPCFPWWCPHRSTSATVSERFTPPTPITTPVMNVPVESPGGPPVRSPSREFVCGPPGMQTEGGVQLHHLPVVQIQKKEIPPEHPVLKTTFENLVRHCSSVATDVKTKRKLEDATQRLECLYEKLQEQALSRPVLLGLHEMARCAGAGGYQQALALHVQVVSSSSFSNVSSFMPALKALLAVAQKLSV
uniref:protein transport protein Sec31B n=1 Tax=Euleptes europaea TaxID=460621 RepID=UPI00253F9386|nr:protein transport protein Sec31B [Euleptes europaea]